MKWYITRRRMLWVIVVLMSVLALFLAFGCTAREKKAATETGGSVSRMLGLPPFVGESVVSLAIGVATYLKGHQRGRRKERACHMPLTPKVQSP